MICSETVLPVFHYCVTGPDLTRAQSSSYGGYSAGRDGYRECERKVRWVACKGRRKIRRAKRVGVRSRLVPLAIDYTRLSRPKPNREPVRGLWDGSRAAVYYMKTTAGESGRDRTQGSWMAWTNNRNNASSSKAITVDTTTARYNSLRELLHLPHDNCYFRKLRMSFGETWEMTSWSFFFFSRK